jgi:hypothetical protein
MKKLIYSLMMLSAILFYAAAQENILFYELQKAKQSQAVFRDVSALLVKVDADKIIEQKNKNNDEKNIFITD